MENLVYFNKFYLDKEKDIIVNLYKSNIDELTYILETPNHNTGNLITNLAKICNIETIKNENEMKIIKGVIPASINGDNEEVYIFRLGGIKIANIYKDKIEIKAKIPAIIKTLMSQTKNYKLPVEKSIVKTFIREILVYNDEIIIVYNFTEPLPSKSVFPDNIDELKKKSLDKLELLTEDDINKSADLSFFCSNQYFAVKSKRNKKA